MASNDMALDFEWIPEPRVLANQFYTWAGELEDFTIPLDESRPIVAADVEQRFASEGPGWAPWDYDYGEYGKHGPSVLTRTGALRAHATSEESFIVQADSLVYAPLSELDGMHQEGTSKMPARPFMGLSVGGMEKVEEVFGLWLDSIFSSARTAPGESLVPTPSGVRFRGAGGRFVRSL